MMLMEQRDRTPVSVSDVNFNSPGHDSSQDGSFMQVSSWAGGGEGEQGSMTGSATG